MAINTQKWGNNGNEVIFRTGSTAKATFLNLQKDRPSTIAFGGMTTGLAAWAYLNAGIDRSELWDPSICFWGAGAGRYGNGRTCFDYKHVYVDNSLVAHTDQDAVKAPAAVPLAFGSWYPGYNADQFTQFSSGRRAIYDTQMYTYNHAVMPTDSNTSTYAALLGEASNAVPNFLELQLAPIVKYNIADLKMLIVVQASNSKGYGGAAANYIVCDLPEYERQMSNYPYVLGVELRAFAKGASRFDAVDWGSNNTTRGLGILTLYTPTIAAGEEISEPMTIYGRQHLGAAPQAIKGYNTADPTNPLTYASTARGVNIGGTGLGSSYVDGFNSMTNKSNFFIPGADRWTVDSAVSSYAYHNCYWNITTQADFDDLKAYCMQSAAFVGLPFTERYEELLTTTATNSTHMGLRDDNGNTTGQWVSGADIPTRVPAYNWTDPSTQSEYDPYHPAGDDPNKYITQMPNKQSMDIANFYNVYAMTSANVTLLNRYLQYLPTLASTYSQYSDYQLAMSNKFLNSNPIECITTLKWYPCDVQKYCFNAASQITVQISNNLATWTDDLGNTYTVQGYNSIIKHMITTLYLGNFDIYAAYNNFLDYEPYSSAKLYLPYAATVDIDIKQILNKKIYVQYKVDFRTGTATAYVTQDSYQGIVIATAPAHLSVDIPVTGVQSADYQNAIYQAVSNLKQATAAQFAAYVQTAATAITAATAGAANPMTLFAGVARTAGAAAGLTATEQSIADARYSLNTAPIKHMLVNSTTAGDAALMYQYPALIVTRPQMLDTYNSEIYAHTIGNAVVAQVILSQVAGFTVVSDIDTTGIVASQAEISQIKSLLAQGVYF